MIHIALRLIVTTFLGFLSGLGVGGGSLLFLWLTIVEGFSKSDAKFINLASFLPTALIASFFHWKHGQLHPKRIFFPAAVGCIAASFCSSYSNSVNQDLIRKLLGALFVFSSIKEFTWKDKKQL